MRKEGKAYPMTIIAAALVGLVAQNYISEAWATTNVYVTNASKIGRAVARYQ